MDQIEANRARIDEERVAALLEDLPALLTESERAKLRECAETAAAQNCRMAEIGLEAARRHSDTDVEEINRREAIGRYYTTLLFQCMERMASENLIEN
jgi:hypothetical protein